MPVQSTARLEARIPADVYALVQRAARLKGMTLTGYVTAIIEADARHIINEYDMICLSNADQKRFVETLLAPPEPNSHLQRAVRCHADLIG